MDAASTWGTPARSRVTVTGAPRPARVRVPRVTGRLRRTTILAATTAMTTSAARTMAATSNGLPLGESAGW